MKSKKFLALFLTVATVFILSACGTSSDLDTLVVANGADPITFDIQKTNDQATTRIARQIYETLVFQNEELELLPGLATSWTYVGDDTYEFVLRDDVYFHNGEKFTAADVEYTMRRALTSGTIAHIVGSLDPDKIEVVNDTTIRLGTKMPFGPFITHLAHPATAILNEKAVVDGGEDYGTSSAVGTGPFKFVEWVSGDKVVLARNENYYGELAKVAKIEFRTIRESSVRLIALENGEVDIAYDISPADTQAVLANSSLELINTPNLGAEYLGLNQASNVYLQDLNVRKAIAHIMDVPAMIQTIFQNVGSQMSGPINSSVFGFNSELTPYEYNETLAQQFLSESAWPTGGFTLRLYVGDNNQERISVAQVVQAQLAKLNITVVINQMEWGAFLAETAKPAETTQAGLFLLGWTTVTADADYGLYPLFHSQNTPAAGNRTFYANAQVDAYLETGRNTSDQEVRRVAYEAAQAIIHDELPWVFLQTRENVTALSVKVQGFKHHPMGSYFLAGVSKTA